MLIYSINYVTCNYVTTRLRLIIFMTDLFYDQTTEIYAEIFFDILYFVYRLRSTIPSKYKDYRRIWITSNVSP